MKIILILLLFLPLYLSAEDFFRSVSTTADTWEVQFQQEGIRYHIKIDGTTCGISEYLQTLELNKKEELELAGKHSTHQMRWSEEHEGIKIISTHRDLSSGKLKTSTRLELPHHPEDRSRQ